MFTLKSEAILSPSSFKSTFHHFGYCSILSVVMNRQAQQKPMGPLHSFPSPKRLNPKTQINCCFQNLHVITVLFGAQKDLLNPTVTFSEIRMPVLREIRDLITRIPESIVCSH